VYAPSGELWWARNHAVLPTAEVVDQAVIRVYFASLDEHQYGRIGYVDLDAKDPKRILYEAQEPILNIGDPGAFDDCGVNPSCIVRVGQSRYFYYSGWQRCERAPYMLFAGLAIADDASGSFTKSSRAPVLDRTASEPFSRAAPFVLADGNTLRMWYWSCEFWSQEDGWTHYNGVIRYAESTDGIHWNSRDRPCLAPDRPDDYSVGRPWVVKDGTTYRMWYSIRSKAQTGYRIGYAESIDRVTWTRKDREAGIQTSASGWDSEMICYPCVVDANGSRYMFYNGNRRGSTGFGYAVFEP
jgi:predicted GH43/DUF377 family glycosyl hydrolase